ncbi:MAG: hypothetical protein VX346_10375 [Planctomycetota bacterium]|nr:hypothetical protein [Planctomycetota bacterium]
MRQGTIFFICLPLSVLLATVFSQQPDRASAAEKSDPAVVVVQARLEGFLPQVIASLTARYQLDATAGVRLGQAIRESIATALKQPQMAKRLTAVSSTYEADGKLLEVLLAHPPCREAFARHLSPAQLQDYVEFINSWGRRGRQAAARRMTAWLDGRLLLSSAQRQQVEQLLVRSTQEDLADLLWSEPAAWQPLHDIHGRASFLSRLARQSGKQLTAILSPTQTDLWRLLVAPRQTVQPWWGQRKVGNRDGKQQKADQRAILFRQAQAEIQQALKEGVITRQQAQQKLADVKRQLFEDEDDDRVEDAERRRVFRQGQLKIERAVQAGQLTQQEAVRELANLQRRMFGDDEDEDEGQEAAADDEALQRVFRQGRLKIERAVQAGQLTRQEAVRELANLQQRLSDDVEDDLAGQREEEARGLNNRDREEVYQAARAALEQAVQAGQVARDQVAPRLAALKARLWRNEEDEQQDPWDDEARGDAREFAYTEIEDEMGKLLADDGLTQELARAYLTSVKQQLFKEELDQEDALQRAYQISQKLIEKLVAVNQLSAAAATDHLSGLQDRFWNNKARRDEFDKNDPEARQIAFANAAQEVREQLAAGELTQQQAGRRIDALKKKMFDKVEKRGDDRLDLFNQAKAELAELVAAGKLNQQQMDQELGGLKKRLWAEKADLGWGDKQDPRGFDPQWSQRIATARLAVHTAQLGPLDDRVARRLALAAKGVLQQQFEAGVGLAEQAPTTVRRQPDDEDRSRGRAAAVTDDVLQHPLYQRTLRRFLAAEVLAREQARRESRKAYQIQALRQLAVAVLDAHLLFDEPQLQQLEATAAELSLPNRQGAVSAAARMLAQLSRHVERASLRPEQQQRLTALCRWLEIDDADFEGDEK